MPASVVWRGCWHAYLAGVALFAVIYMIAGVIGGLTASTLSLMDIPTILLALGMITLFAAAYGLVLALPLAGLAFLINGIFRPSAARVHWWVPTGIVAGLAFLIMPFAAIAAAGACVGFAFWMGIRR